MKSTPFNGRYGLGQAQQRSVAHHEDIEANYAYLETQDSDLYKDKLNYYLNVLKRRKWYAIFTSFIIIPIIAINMISEEKIYESSTRLLIEDDNPQILNIKEITTPDKSTNFFQTEYQRIRTKENIEEVVNTLQLDKEVPSKKPTFLEDIGQNEILLTEYKKRLVLEKDFFTNPNVGAEFLEKYDIKYIS